MTAADPTQCVFLNCHLNSTICSAQEQVSDGSSWFCGGGAVSAVRLTVLNSGFRQCRSFCANSIECGGYGQGNPPAYGGNGGAVCAESLTINNSAFIDCSAEKRGGAAFTARNLLIENSRFYCPTDGPSITGTALYHTGFLQVSDTLFEDCRAPVDVGYFGPVMWGCIFNW